MNKISFKLRFNKKYINKWANEYDSDSDNDKDLIRIKTRIQKNCFLNLGDLKKVCKWKSPRSAWNVDKNSDDYVKELSKYVLSTKNERARIEIPTLFDGVRWPTSSVILHFFHKDQYPILDFRALWSLSVKVPAKYDFDFWWGYTKYCRKIANQNKITMRTLDRALWKYSKENQ